MRSMRSGRVTVHASCVVIGSAGHGLGASSEAGVLLLGPSGAGKSDLALRLLERGAMLVADDRAELFVRDRVLMARAPAGLRGLIEIRGVGILEFSYAQEAPIVLALALGRAGPRLPEAKFYEVPPELALDTELRTPLLRLDARESSAPAKVIAAVAGLAQSPFHHRNTMS